MKTTRVGAMLVLGNDEARIEEGPMLKTAVATAELLNDDNTAPHYFEGVREITLTDAEGKQFTEQMLGRDALAKPIKLGEEMSYLDHGGKVAQGERCFYVYVRRPIDPTKQYNKDGSVNRYFVPKHVREAKVEGLRSRTHMTYYFEEVGTAKSEDAAVEIAEKHLAKAPKE